MFYKLSRRKYKYFPREVYYGNLLNKFGDVDAYYKIKENLSNKRLMQTQKEIGFFKNKSFCEISPQDVKREFGKPNFVINQNHSSIEVTILFYRILLGDHKTKFELHFHKKKLVLYSYTFSYINEDDKLEIRKCIENKYLSNNPLKYKTDYVKDGNGSVISFSNNIDFIIYYTSNSTFFKKVSELLAERELEKELLIKRKKRELYYRL